MSRTFDLFLATDRGAGELAAELAGLLGSGPVAATFRDGRPRWAFDDGEVQVDLSASELDGPDRDLHFERYEYQVTFRDRRGSGRPPEVALELAEHRARRLFEQLRARGEYPMLLTDDLQHKLDEFDPG